MKPYLGTVDLEEIVIVFANHDLALEVIVAGVRHRLADRGAERFMEDRRKVKG